MTISSLLGIKFIDIYSSESYELKEGLIALTPRFLGSQKVVFIPRWLAFFFDVNIKHVFDKVVENNKRFKNTSFKKFCLTYEGKLFKKINKCYDELNILEVKKEARSKRIHSSQTLNSEIIEKIKEIDKILSKIESTIKIFFLCKDKNMPLIFSNSVQEFFNKNFNNYPSLNLRITSLISELKLFENRLLSIQNKPL